MSIRDQNSIQQTYAQTLKYQQNFVQILFHPKNAESYTFIRRNYALPN
jgi:hypothetical protein